MNAKPEVYNREKAIAHMEKHGLDVKHLEAWIVKLKVLRRNAPGRGSNCTLTLSQYVKLAIRAGITHPNQIGQKSSSYQMARIGDKGDYIWGNCRFITLADNIREKGENGGTESMAASKRGLTKYNHAGTKQATLKRSKQFVVQSPRGKIFKGINLKEFAETHGLNQGGLSAVCRGVTTAHKGWTGKYVEQTLSA